MAPPPVSVLLPVHDEAPWLPSCLDSLSRQTFADFEVVAVDDGSADGSGALLEAHARRDSRFRVLRRPHRGLVPTLTEALEHCRGPLIARMDGDDLAHRRRLELQVARMEEQPELAAVSCRVRCFPCAVPGRPTDEHAAVGRGMRLYEAWLNGLETDADLRRERFVESPVANPTALLRRSWIDRLGGWRDGPGGSSDAFEMWPEDYDFWLRLMAAGGRLAKVPQVLHFWREHPGRVTHTDPRYGKDRFLACKAHHLARHLEGRRGGEAGETRPLWIWGAGPTGRRLARELERRGVPVAAFVDIDPTKVGRRLRGGVPVLAPEALEIASERSSGPRPLLLATVAARGARQEIRQRLQGLGLSEGVDFWCAA